MPTDFELYKEKLEADFSITHKVTKSNEKDNFHIHDELEIILILSDGMKCIVGNKTYFLPKNTLLLFNNMDLHHLCMTKPGINDRYVLYFKPEYIQTLSTETTNLLECFFFRPFPDPYAIPLTENDTKNVIFLLERIKNFYNNFTDKEYGLDLFKRISLAEFLLQVNTLYRNQHQVNSFDSSQNYNLIFNIINYIHKNYWNEISLDFLSKEFFINKFYLCNIFKQVTGTPLNQYLINCRLMKAKELLLKDRTVEDVCFEVGYNNLSHFSRSFKKYIGKSPKQFQMESRK